MLEVERVEVVVDLLCLQFPSAGELNRETANRDNRRLIYLEEQKQNQEV